ncbi:MAG TPA: hypothetical protein VFD05_03500 [Bacilli bacterium]|nr:hypothetical protein [Bacilli bacterium]
MKEPIYERIINEATKEADALIAGAKKDAQQKLAAVKKKLTEEHTEFVVSAKLAAKSKVSDFEAKEERDLANFTEQTKQEIVVNLFLKAYEELKEFKGEALLKYALNLINRQKVLGTEEIQVSKDNYNKYLTAFSTKKDRKDLDLLNAGNKKYKFVLSAQPVLISEGFLLSGEKYDLIFDFKEIIDVYQRQHEQKIYKELFGDE